MVEFIEEHSTNPFFRLFEGGVLSKKAFLEGISDTVVYWGSSGQKITDSYTIDSFSMAVPDNMKILHEKEFQEHLLQEYDDEVCFRLINRLGSINANDDSSDFVVKTIGCTKEFDAVATLINACYDDIFVTGQQVLKWSEHPTYNENLWITITQKATDKCVGIGIAEFDIETNEGILEWVQILPQFRKMGIGQLLVNQLLLRLSSLADFVTVSGKADSYLNPQALYRKCGFDGDGLWHILCKKQQ